VTDAGGGHGRALDGLIMIAISLVVGGGVAFAGAL
jgi:hypothetical protein